ncbi:SGNH/GDSL hydrolase family protein [Sphingomonas sp. RHCKR47]|uniref:SGNH/GDSL hydrolase family protein n=1 Tax=Sphingomonas citricola TaxID=2862498 RepID=UPI001CA4A961|nr:SGNH/GDSL hydrolase family protein [Sphingomonas citricola]MBW6522389.1 SGNH/GDSL hydrolase family protein [Sphingomonas citricola]
MAAPAIPPSAFSTDPVARKALPIPCSIGTNFPFQSSASAGITAGQQAGFRVPIYIPQGCTNPRLLFVGGAVAGATEAALATGFPLKVSVEVGQGWNPSKTYAPGDVVMDYATNGGGGSYGSNPYFVCVTANTNSRPSPTNANWAAGSRPTTYPVTFNGVQDCSFGTQTLPDGTVVARGTLLTDSIPVTVPVGGILVVWAWLPCSGSQVFPVSGQSMAMSLGVVTENGTTVTDRTASGGNASPRSANASQFAPVAVLGQPLAPTPTAAIIGDSIGQGKTGTSSLSSVTLQSGGSGYRVADILTLGRNGATPGAVAAGSDAKVIVDAVSSGAITALRVIDAGGYTSTATQTGQALPSGTISLSGGSGTGATVTASFGTNPYDMGDSNGAQGYLARAMSQRGIPYVMAAAAGDRLNLWTGGRSFTRMAALATCNATTAVIALARNDLSAGDSASAIQANLATFAARLRGMGVKRLIVCTATPETTSTTAAGASSIADQSVTANDPARQALNAWMRAGAGGIFDAVADVAAAVEQGGASVPTGKWITINGEPAAADGKHPGIAAIALMQAVVATATFA